MILSFLPIQEKLEEVTVASRADAECSNGPEGTSDCETNDAAVEGAGKMKSSEILPKNRCGGQEDGIAQEVGL